MRKKTVYLIIVFLCVSAISFSQEKNVKSMFAGATTELTDAQPAMGIIIYDFNYVPDTTKRDSILNEKLELDFGKTASNFESYTARLRDSIIQKDILEQLNKYESAGGDIFGNIKLNTPDLGKGFNTLMRDKFYTSLKNPIEVLQILPLVNAQYLIKDSTENINWKIEDSTKDIQGNLCQKAIGKSHGRTYTAWFCSNIPYSFGPRRLCGLPGLILEAYDEKREVVFTLDHIEMNVKKTIGLPKNGIYASKKDYDRALDAFMKNPQAFFAGQLRGTLLPANSNAKITPIKIDGALQGREKAQPINNPIDLK